MYTVETVLFFKAEYKTCGVSRVLSAGFGNWRQNEEEGGKWRKFEIRGFLLQFVVISDVRALAEKLEVFKKSSKKAKF